MKWTDTYPDEIRAFLAVLIIMNDMIIVPRFERYFISEDSKWYLQIPGITASLRLSEAERNERGETQFLCRK